MDIHKDVHYQVKHLASNARSLQENSQSERAHYCSHVISYIDHPSLKIWEICEEPGFNLLEFLL